jgi:hypothetical protein
MLRLALAALLISAGTANAQLLDRRQPTTIFESNGRITNINPTPGGGFFASDNRGGMAMGTGSMIMITRPAPMLPTLTPPTTSNFD